MRIATRVLFGTVLTVLLCCSALAADSAPRPNYQGLWWNAPPASESGWGINLAHQGDAIFATWFTYDAAGDGWWLSMTADKVAEGTYTGTLVEAMGPAYGAMPYNPYLLTRTVVGSGTLAFRDADNATFSYAIKGVQQSKSITRLAFGPLPACSYSAQPDLANATNYQDLWWAAGGTESGWGINLAHQGDVIFATWFTFDNDGTPLWFAVTAPRIAQGVYGGALIRTTGPAFNASPFDPAKVTRKEVGTATLTFANGNAATFAYTLDGLARSKAISRNLFAPPAGTRCRESQGLAIKGKVFDGTLERVVVCADANGNCRCDPDEAHVLSDAQGAYELPVATPFNGSLVAEVVAGQSRETAAQGKTIDRSFRMATPARDYSANITPYTTLVLLSKEPNFRTAEEMVRNVLGLPPGFRINLDAAPAEGSLAQAVEKAIAAALQATVATLDFTAPDALARVVAAFPPALTELPQLRIRTKDGVPITSKEVYVDATFTLTNPAASVAQAELNGRIRGRGNTTWMQDKKPYKIQFTNDAAYARVPDFLGMKKNRNWALLADHLDRSLLRNKLAFTLGNSSLFADGLKWTPSGQHVEVNLNGDSIGVYLLSEDIRLDPARLNIRKMSSSASANQVDGGYIVEVDYPLDCYHDGAISLQHRTPEGTHICVDTPDEAAILPAQLAYIKKLLDDVEADIHAGRNLARINPVSFADWYLLQELFRNHDAVFYSSDFMWKDTAAAAIPADRLLNMGPIWDFDLSAGNTNFYGNWEAQGCWVTKSLDFTPNWYSKLFNNRDFLDLVLARWKDKRPALQRLVNASIDAFARRLQPAQQRNFERWPVLGTQNWMSRYVFPNHAGEVAFLRQFLNDRMAWLDQAFESPASFAELCR